MEVDPPDMDKNVDVPTRSSKRKSDGEEDVFSQSKKRARYQVAKHPNKAETSVSYAQQNGQVDIVHMVIKEGQVYWSCRKV